MLKQIQVIHVRVILVQLSQPLRTELEHCIQRASVNHRYNLPQILNRCFQRVYVGEMFLGPGIVVDELDVFHLWHLFARETHPMSLCSGVQLVPEIIKSTSMVELEFTAAFPVSHAG